MVGAILVNAGNANCATRTGDRVALASCRAVAKLLKLPPAQVLPASTGVIGVELDFALIEKALPRLVAALAENRFSDVARAIMTTDLVPKEAASGSEAAPRHGAHRRHDQGLRHDSTAHGHHPGICTHRREHSRPRNCDRILTRAIERSYNRISVDGDTSTNDTMILMANGCSGVRPDPQEFAAFEEGVAEVMETLARMIARDGEGAKKLITIDVTGAANDDAAAAIARAIANSPLVKTAVAGSDPNWGRIICAAGNAGVAFDPAKVDIEMQNVTVCRGGLAAPLFGRRPQEESWICLSAPFISRFAARQRPCALLDVRFHRRLHSDQCQLPDLISRAVAFSWRWWLLCSRRSSPIRARKSSIC